MNEEDFFWTFSSTRLADMSACAPAERRSASRRPQHPANSKRAKQWLRRISNSRQRTRLTDTGGDKENTLYEAPGLELHTRPISVIFEHGFLRKHVRESAAFGKKWAERRRKADIERDCCALHAPVVPCASFPPTESITSCSPFSPDKNLSGVALSCGDAAARNKNTHECVQTQEFSHIWGSHDAL